MFMEPGAKPDEGGRDAGAPVADPDHEAEADDAEAEPPKKRGWTMFMNAPLEDLPQTEAGAPAAEQAPSGSVEAADKQGWTVFGAPAPERAGSAEAAASAAPVAEEPDPASGPSASSRGQTVMVTRPSPVPSPGAPDEGAPDAELAGAKTLVNTSEPVGTPVVRGKTIITGAAPAGEKPDTMYFKKGQVEPEGGVSPRAPTVRDVPSPARPAEERDARPKPGSGVPAVPEPSSLEPAKSSNVVLYAIAGAVAVAAAVGAYFAFG